MNSRLPVLAAAMLCCAACVDVDPDLGGNLVPLGHTYTVHAIRGSEGTLPQGAIYISLPDSLSGYSQTRITIGAIRDERFGLSTRSSAMTLVPAKDTLDFGNVAAAKILGFHFAAAIDSVSVASFSEAPIIQQVSVHSLTEPLNPSRDYNCLGTVKYGSESIVRGTPTVNGLDSLTFDFTEEYARKFLQITQEELNDFKLYTKRIPGIYIQTDNPAGIGGRINIFQLQTGYSSSDGYVSGNYARLSLRCDYDRDGVAEKDTSFFFMMGLTDFTDVDSLFNYSTRGNFPEYALNLTSHETSSLSGGRSTVSDIIPIEGGGGLKPVISSLSLKHFAEDLIISRGGDPATAVINKASLKFPFPFPEDYREMYKFPQVLSPTCRLRQGDTLVVFAGLTDASSADENQGEINRSTLVYEPDITYHLQEILKINERPVEGESGANATRRAKLLAGEYDIWLIITAHETVVTEASTQELNDYYQALAYQQYYNSMYGGYGGYGYGYGGYGYGGYGGYGYNSYSNYYNMMMLSSMYSSSTSSSNTVDQLDKDRYYSGTLYGPLWPDESLRPRLELTFSLANEE